MQTKSLNETDWWASLRLMDRYSFFITPQWGHILSNSRLGIKSKAFLFQFPEGDVLFPCGLSRNRLGLLYCQSMPYGCYGGPRIIRQEVGSSRTNWQAQIRRYLHSGFLFGRFTAVPGPYPHLSLGQVSTIQATQIMDLSSGIEPVWKSFKNTVQRNIKKAERLNVVIKEDQSIESYQNYYRMLEASSIRWGREKLDKPWSLFETICTSSSDLGNIKLWMAYWQGLTVAGMLWFYGKGEAFYWSGAMYKEYASSRANELLMWHITQDAYSKGYNILNLGSSGDLEGVYKYKEGFGAKKVEYPVYGEQSILMRYVQKIAGIRRIN